MHAFWVLPRNTFSVWIKDPGLVWQLHNVNLDENLPHIMMRVPPCFTIFSVLWFKFIEGTKGMSMVVSRSTCKYILKHFLFVLFQKFSPHSLFRSCQDCLYLRLPQLCLCNVYRIVLRKMHGCPWDRCHLEEDIYINTLIRHHKSKGPLPRAKEKKVLYRSWLFDWIFLFVFGLQHMLPISKLSDCDYTV